MNKYQRLATLLVKKTNEGTADWQPTSKNGVFSLSLPDYSVWISMIRSEEGTEDVVLQIVNSDGAVIDGMTDIEIAEGVQDKQAFYKQMARLYSDARRHAFGIEEALDKLLEELEKA